MLTTTLEALLTQENQRGWFGRTVDNTKAFFGFDDTGGFLGTNLNPTQFGSALYAGYDGAWRGFYAAIDGGIDIFPFIDVKLFESMGWYNANEGGYAWSQAIGGLTRDAELMLSGYGFVRGAVGGTGTLGRNLFAVEFAPGPWSLMLGGERALSTSSVTISYGIKWSGRIESYRSLNRAVSGEDPTP